MKQIICAGLCPGTADLLHWVEHILSIDAGTKCNVFSQDLRVLVLCNPETPRQEQAPQALGGPACPCDLWGASQ